MSHARTKIREAIKTLLDGTGSWTAVFTTRVSSPRAIWPYLMVYADGEPIEQVSVTSGVYERSATFAIMAMLRVPGNGDKQTIEDKIDDICAEIESKITVPRLTSILSGSVRAEFTGTAMTVVVDEEDKVSHAEATLSLTVKYFTAEGKPETML